MLFRQIVTKVLLAMGFINLSFIQNLYFAISFDRAQTSKKTQARKEMMKLFIFK